MDGAIVLAMGVLGLLIALAVGPMPLPGVSRGVVMIWIVIMAIIVALLGAQEGQ